MLTDHNFDKKAGGLAQKLAGKKHAEYVFTRFDSGNTGMARHKLYIF